MVDNKPIGLFDSGVGGLSIYREIAKFLPKESFIFLADQAHNPYGVKNRRDLQKLSEEITKFLLNFDIKILVIACNTVTCYALSYLRSKFKIPIVGVVPAVKPAAKLTKKNKIAIMSTPATAKSHYLKALIREFANQKQVLKVGCDGLEESIEYLVKPKIESILERYCQKIVKFDPDVVILGCTHYPFVKDDIQKRIGESVKIVDSAEAIAKRVRQMLLKNNALSKRKFKDIFFTTGQPDKFSQVASALLNRQIQSRRVYVSVR